ncbi:ABC-2 type transport system ATP-binding protein [Haloferula luteola]|uniref:ABC-2 type transport system ATP-binding protein n=1 Tax=Haloferula luteola TaxID=595692 RepID=A0A840V0E3_9BACT|nr:ABC transporter ATP-binding protein [Haloferula luteola]MBB5351472.1 ABC-2 type transport system ATP-binding protein [Haloferula luteola]
MLEIHEIGKNFGSFKAIDKVSLQVAEGETVGLLGVNGAGKTTLMNMILGLITPTSGSIRVFGLDLAKHRIEILRRTNFCTTYASLPGNLKVRHNLEIFARLYSVKPPKPRVSELLGLLGIEHLADRITGQLSAGETTRVNLAKALLNDPDLLLLDEPTASLDPDIADRVRTFVTEIQRQRPRSIVYTSHNMKDIEVLCDRIVFLHEGRILAQGTAAELKTIFQREHLDDVFIHVARAKEGELGLP